MKKWFALLLVAALLLSCCAAFAEDGAAASPDFASMKFSGLSGKQPTGMISLKTDSAYALPKSNDTVTVTDAQIQVKIRDLTMNLTLPDAYVCFTQDYFASIRSYALLNNPETLLNYMIDVDSHYYFLDQYTDTETHIDSLESDQVCKIVENLKYLDEKERTQFAEYFALENGLKYEGSYAADTAIWLRFTGAANVYVTIVGGEYLAYFYADAEPEDAEDLLSGLSISG